MAIPGTSKVAQLPVVILAQPGETVSLSPAFLCLAFALKALQLFHVSLDGGAMRFGRVLIALELAMR